MEFIGKTLWANIASKGGTCPGLKLECFIYIYFSLNKDKNMLAFNLDKDCLFELCLPIVFFQLILNQHLHLR
jgi:hypothetical protein